MAPGQPENAALDARRRRTKRGSNADFARLLRHEPRHPGVHARRADQHSHQPEHRHELRMKSPRRRDPSDGIVGAEDKPLVELRTDRLERLRDLGDHLIGRPRRPDEESGEHACRIGLEREIRRRRIRLFGAARVHVRHRPYNSEDTSRAGALYLAADRVLPPEKLPRRRISEDDDKRTPRIVLPRAASQEPDASNREVIGRDSIVENLNRRSVTARRLADRL
jgi:hypothetical protein